MGKLYETLIVDTFHMLLLCTCSRQLVDKCPVVAVDLNERIAFRSREMSVDDEKGQLVRLTIGGEIVFE
jgi:hypothetical protein